MSDRLSFKIQQVSPVTAKIGMQEYYQPYFSARYGVGFRANIVVESTPKGLFKFAEPNFYFSSMFIPMKDKVIDEVTLSGYMNAHKPVYSIMSDSTALARVVGYRDLNGAITSNFQIIKLYDNQLRDSPTSFRAYYSTIRVDEKVKTVWDKTATHILNSISQDEVSRLFKSGSGFARQDFYKYRLGL